MTNRQTRQYQMLLRLREFGESYGKRFSEDTLADEAFRTIGEAITQLNTHVVERLAFRQQSAGTRAAARAALISKMEIISRTARSLEAEDPDFENTFLMPERRSAEAVLAAARLFARDAEPHAAKFKAHGFGSTFPADFQQLLRSYEEAIDEREAGKADTAAWGERIETALASGLAAARRLDILVANELGGDSVAVVEWQRSRRVGYRVPKQAPVASVEQVGAVTVPPGSPGSGPPPSESEVPDVADAVTTTEVAAPVDLSPSETPEGSAAGDADEEAA